MKKLFFISLAILLVATAFSLSVSKNESVSCARAADSKNEKELKSLKAAFFETTTIELGEGFRDDTREITVSNWERRAVESSATATKEQRAADAKQEIITLEVVLINRAEGERKISDLLGIRLRDAAGKAYLPLFSGGIKASDVADGKVEILASLSDSLLDNEPWYGQIGFRLDKSVKDVDAVFSFEQDELILDLRREPKKFDLDDIKWEGAGESAPAKAVKQKSGNAGGNNEGEFEFVDENKTENSSTAEFKIECEGEPPFPGSMCEKGKWLTEKEMENRLEKAKTSTEFENLQPIKPLSCSECHRALSLRCTLKRQNSDIEEISVCNPIAL